MGHTQQAETNVRASATDSVRHGLFSSSTAIVLYIAAASFLAHMLTAGRYGYFRDELYYLACARHLALGYVDQPPLIALVTWLTVHTIGASLPALHFLPALAGAAVIWLTGIIARELGGGRFAQGFAALSIALAGVFVTNAHLLTMNVVEPLFWMGCAYLIIRIIKTGDPQLWIWFGVLAGIGLENKYSMALFGFAVVVGLLLTAEREVFRSPWIWLAGAIAFAIFLPNLIWNVRHHWPFIELMHNIRASGRDNLRGPLAFLGEQIFIMSPLNFPIWLAGLLFLFFDQGAKRFRVLGWAFLAVVATTMLLHGKGYYAAPVYPMLLAAGAVVIEGVAKGRRWLKPASMAILIAGTAPLLPMMLPILPLETYVQYQEWLHRVPPVTEKSHLRSPLPQYYSDDLGWEEMTAAVAEAYHRLPLGLRSVTAVYAQNYGEAGAIDLFGPKYGLPKAISAHQNYYLWGPRKFRGLSMIVLGDTREHLEQYFGQVIHAGTFGVPYSLEKGPVWVCTQPRGWNLQQMWPKLKKWD
ncbi:MAG TPA: glycosyltransferase family 39 protein [Terriglobia bacterium]|nr:glycosyltransferase family 39 protein [Terriglobia bacterium]